MQFAGGVVSVGRLCFAIALLGLGAEHFVFHAFVTGRAPEWPASLPGGTAWAYLSGAVVIGVGLAIMVRRREWPAAVLAAAVILLWAVLRHLPVVASDALLAPSWTRAGKALMLFGGVLAVAGGAQRAGVLVLGRVCLGVFFLITGTQHFIYTPFVASLIPGWFPGDAVLWTRFAGVGLIAGGAGLLLPRTAPLAALLSGLMVFSWVWIVHLPRTFASVSDGIAVFEALAVSGMALVLAGALWPYGKAGQVTSATSAELSPRRAPSPRQSHTG